MEVLLTVLMVLGIYIILPATIALAIVGSLLLWERRAIRKAAQAEKPASQALFEYSTETE
jgi:hypothetical protein